jgi:hypothetical protein
VVRNVDLVQELAVLAFHLSEEAELIQGPQ